MLRRKMNNYRVSLSVLLLKRLLKIDAPSGWLKKDNEGLKDQKEHNERYSSIKYAYKIYRLTI